MCVFIFRKITIKSRKMNTKKYKNELNSIAKFAQAFD